MLVLWCYYIPLFCISMISLVLLLLLLLLLFLLIQLLLGLVAGAGNNEAGAGNTVVDDDGDRIISL